MMEQMWLAADYHFPSTYSCRVPMSSASNALAMPAPGPGTVRLALLHTGIELFGVDAVREELFPTLCAASVRIRPPERVAISPHLLHAHKWEVEKKTRRERVQKSLMIREMAHATGNMTVFLQVPKEAEKMFRAVLKAVGYWGQTSSFACCLGVDQRSPEPEEVATPLGSLNERVPLQQFYSCLASDFRDAQVSWQEIVVEVPTKKTHALQFDIYVWPMLVQHHHGEGKLLVRHLLMSEQEEANV